MTNIRINLNQRENAKVERLRRLWGLKSKEKAIRKAVSCVSEPNKPQKVEFGKTNLNKFWKAKKES